MTSEAQLRANRNSYYKLKQTHKRVSVLVPLEIPNKNIHQVIKKYLEGLK